VVTLNITPTNSVSRNTDIIENIVIVDLLPSGFEIENTRIESRGDFPNIPKNDIYLEYQDIRDDRLILFVKDCPYQYNSYTKLYVPKAMRYSYVVNAVTAGEFVVPQFSVEAMYDPSMSAKTKGGEIVKIIEN
jgi:uncharacterized protein YfaS (alpha-2-macroglobulin family)